MVDVERFENRIRENLKNRLNLQGEVLEQKTKEVLNFFLLNGRKITGEELKAILGEVLK